MFEQDWILRQIKEITKVVAHIVFGAEVHSSALMLQQQEKEKADDLIDKLKLGRIQEAVDAVYVLSENNTKENLLIGLEFYAQLSDMEEEFLIENGYSLVKAKNDFMSFAERFGMEQMTQLYFGKDE